MAKCGGEKVEGDVGGRAWEARKTELSRQIMKNVNNEVVK